MTPFDIQYSKKELDLSTYYGDISLYPYARYALYEYLKVSKVKSIYIPDFICRDMLSPINKLKIKLFFYKVTNELTPILDDVKCDAILFVNYFGFEQDIAPYHKYKEKFGALIIEDNAHGLFSLSKGGILLGTRGDIGLLSIRKTVSLPNGAALIQRVQSNRLITEKAQVKLTDEDIKYKKKERVRRLLPNQKLGIFGVKLLRLIRKVRTGSDNPLPDSESERCLPQNKYLTPMLQCGVLHIDLDNEVIRRCAMFQEVSELAEKYGIKALLNLYAGVSPFEFAFIDDGRSKEYEKALYKKGYYILPWPDLPEEVKDTVDKDLKNIKVVPFLW